jgi:flagellar basal body-associated protein FliL
VVIFVVFIVVLIMLLLAVAAMIPLSTLIATFKETSRQSKHHAQKQP